MAIMEKNAITYYYFKGQLRLPARVRPGRSRSSFTVGLGRTLPRNFRPCLKYVNLEIPCTATIARKPDFTFALIPLCLFSYIGMLSFVHCRTAGGL